MYTRKRIKNAHLRVLYARVYVVDSEGNMREATLERKLKKRIENEGGLCLKWVSPGYTGVPDRIVLMKGGVIAFVETKRPGQRERQRQAFVQARLRKMGFPVFGSVDSWQKADDVLCWCAAKMSGVDHEV